MGENNKPHFIQQGINTQANVIIISCFMNKLVIIYVVLK